MISHHGPGALTLLAAAAWHGAATRQVQAQGITFEQCSLPGVQGEVRCGTYPVREDRSAEAGRTIPVFVAVLPALESPGAPDPLFVLGGGPGQGATSIAGFASVAFAPVRRRRDIVLVDLPGTGRSRPLNCRMYRTPEDLVGDLYPLHRLAACRDSLARHTDLRRYTTPLLMDDLDQIRAALGYDQINIYGTSYGTRAALVYTRRHRAHVRTLVLKAVAPTTMRGTMDYARDTERALQRLFQACAGDSACTAAFPDPAGELREVLARADGGILRGRVPDPAGGPPVELPLSRGVVASTLLGVLQNSNAAVRLPQLVHTTYLGDTRALVEMIVGYRRGVDAALSLGMHLSVMCTEDAPRMDPIRAAVADRGTALGDYRVAQLAAACSQWVQGEVSPDYAEPVRSDVPALLVSGTLDPNTNERWGEEAARTLTRSTHVVIPNLSHSFSSIAECGADFIAEFISAGSADRLDLSCTDRVRLPPFAAPTR